MSINQRVWVGQTERAGAYRWQCILIRDFDFAAYSGQGLWRSAAWAKAGTRYNASG